LRIGGQKGITEGGVKGERGSSRQRRVSALDAGWSGADDPAFGAAARR